jgi:hypothetical protein
MSIELLEYHHMYIDGSRIEETGFYYEHPTISTELLVQAINNLVESNLFPPVVALISNGEKENNEEAKHRK